MFRLLLGIVKGAVIGAGVGYGVYQLGLGAGWNFAIYGAIGLLVGLFVGRPIWSHLFDPKSTIWTAILKGMFGFGVGVGLWALGTKVMPEPSLALLGGIERPLSGWPQLFGAVVGLLYGAWVELDDPPVKRQDEQGGRKSGKK